MFDLNLDPTTGDLSLGADGDLELLEGAGQVAQAITIRLRTRRSGGEPFIPGEWAFDESMGLDTRGKIIVTNPNVRAIEAEVVGEVFRVNAEQPGAVETIEDLTLDFDAPGRILAIELTVRTPLGVVSVSA